VSEEIVGSPQSKIHQARVKAARFRLKNKTAGRWLRIKRELRTFVAKLPVGLYVAKFEDATRDGTVESYKVALQELQNELDRENQADFFDEGVRLQGQLRRVAHRLHFSSDR